MAEPRVVPSQGQKDVATFTVLVDGSAIPRTFEVSGVVVFKGIGRLSFARIELLDGDPAAGTFAASSDALFAPGKELEIQAGYRSQEARLFKGILVGQKLRIRQSGRSLLTLVCRHPLFKATLAKKNRTHLDVTDGDAIAAALSDYSVTLDRQSSVAVTHERLVQLGATDWDFALARARASGAFLIPTDDGVTLADPSLSGDPALELVFGATILELDAELDARTQPTEVTATAWDPAAQEVLSSTGTEPSPPEAGNLSASDLSAIHGQVESMEHSGALTQEELDAFTAARLLTRRLCKITGRVTCIGTTAVEPGSLVRLTGLGDRFSGTVLATAVRHVLVDGSFRTDIQFGAPEVGEPASTPDDPSAATALVPLTRGLHIGVVEALSGDPESEYRVRVRLPVLGDSAEAVWARLARPDAGDGRGFVVYPELGDEVVVGFVNDDPRHPVVLGSLFSSARAAPLSPTDENPERAYVSRGGHRLAFDDEANVVTLETQGGNRILLDEENQGIFIEDQTGNVVVLDTNGIRLESASNLEIKASGDIKVEGSNIELRASAQLTASASAGAELSASANTVIKGALVQIN